MSITILPCQTSDLDTLRAIAYETYDETFRAWNSQETIDRYLVEAFSPEKVLSEVSNPNSRFYFLYVDEVLAGYLKLNDAPAQSDINDPQSLEIERIYIRKAYKGRGLGAQLLDFALSQAAGLGKRYVWLGVWEKNYAAQQFYRKMGFEQVGQHVFRMSDELQIDWVLKKDLPAPPDQELPEDGSAS